VPIVFRFVTHNTSMYPRLFTLRFGARVVARPKVCRLDETFSGLDQTAIASLRESLQAVDRWSLAGRKKAI
jgi:ABC-type molybdenum transport system ATPase subunit/photorepair protein PhrA